jgi:hypothetical protein
MAIDPKEIDNIEKSMVHDSREDLRPEGRWIYLTLRFVSKAVLAAYGLMLLGMTMFQVVVNKGGNLPVSFRPEAALIMLPFAVVAGFFYLASEPENEIAKKRTHGGRVVAVLSVFVAMQIVSIALWILIAKAFSLH